MRNKPLVIALIATTLTTATIATRASAGDPALGALLGAGVGAAIGNSVNHHNGAWVGGAIGAVAGATIAASSGPYYGGAGYAPDYYDYGAPAAPAYYPPATYYAPAPAYYAPPAVVYRSRPVYVGYRPYVRPYPVRYPGSPGWGHAGNGWNNGHGGAQQQGHPGGYPGNRDHHGD